MVEQQAKIAELQQMEQVLSIAVYFVQKLVECMTTMAEPTIGYTITLWPFGNAVRTEAPLRNGRDLIDKLRQDPRSLSMTIGIGLGNMNHIGAALPLRAGGVDVKQVKWCKINGYEVLESGDWPGRWIPSASLTV